MEILLLCIWFFIAEGTENDSIYFLNHVDDDNVRLDWIRFILIYGMIKQI